jgi:hypothetical protein
MATSLPTEQQYELVYQGICAVAARCDGAQSEDGVGFNGQDTHFGRRVAMVPFTEWTDDVKAEAARVANTYQKQILSYTDIDVTTLDVVSEALGRTTNHQARDDARGYERKAKGAAQMAERKIDAVGSMLGIFYAKKDPEFGELLDACKALPGRKFDWDRKCNVVPASEAVEDFVLTWDFPVTDAALAILQAPRAEVFNITLADNGQKVIIDTAFDPALVEAIKALPGRAYVGGSINHADVSEDVIALATQFGLKIHPDARAACSHAQEALEARDPAALAAEDVKTVMAHVSRQQDPTALPPVFLDMLAHVLPTDIAERVISR